MSRSLRPANLHDVARLAGVSYQTVSRVINNHPYVATETRERILKAIDELEYLPNRAARSLITGRSQNLHLVTTNLFFYNPVPAMVKTARELGYALILTPIDPDISFQGLRSFVSDLVSRSSDGILVLNINTNFHAQDMEQLCRGKIPFIQVDGEQTDYIPSIRINQQLGARLAVEHLLQLGHRRMVAITGPMNNYDAIQRHAVTQQILSEHQIQLVDTRSGNHHAAQGYECVNDLLDKGVHFTALICGNDESAIGSIYALQERGLRVPEDVSVIGFDDIPTASYVHPPLTTIRQDYNALGFQAIQHLIKMIEEPEYYQKQIEIDPELMIRSSTQVVK